MAKNARIFLESAKLSTSIDATHCNQLGAQCNNFDPSLRLPCSKVTEYYGTRDPALSAYWDSLKLIRSPFIEMNKLV